MPAGTSHALRQPAAVDRLMAAPMARRTTDTQTRRTLGHERASSSTARRDVPRPISGELQRWRARTREMPERRQKSPATSP